MSTLQAEPAAISVRGRTAYLSLESAIQSLESATASLASDPSRLGRWRVLGELLAARKAFQNHSGACSSPNGPFLHVVNQKPRLQSRVRKIINDHGRIQAVLDRLIARISGDSAGAIEQGEFTRIMSAMRSHQLKSAEVAFEWANRDIGGEG